MPRKYALLAALGLIFVGVQLAHYLHILDELLPHQTHADDRRPIVSRHHPALENDSDAPHRTRTSYTQTQARTPFSISLHTPLQLSLLLSLTTYAKVRLQHANGFYARVWLFLLYTERRSLLLVGLVYVI
jgi:hypothetical protein